MIKKLVYIAVMALLLSCSKGGVEPLLPEGESGVPVAFSPSADWQTVSGAKSSGTKALIEDADDLKKYSISLLGNAVRGGETYPVFKNHELSWSSSEGWHYSPTKYWIPEANYSFAAFCPYATNDESIAVSISNGNVSVSGTDSNPVITITDYNTAHSNAKNEDLLFAKTVRDNRSSEDYSQVELQFEHLLSCLTFNVRNTSQDAITAVRDIALEGLLTLCDISIDLESATVTNKTDFSYNFGGTERNGNSTNSFLPGGMGQSDFKPLFECESLTVLPQDTYNKDIILAFTAYFGEDDTKGTPYTLNLGKIDSIRKWEKGKKYSYNISISSKDIIFQVVEVPWREHNVTL